MHLLLGTGTAREVRRIDALKYTTKLFHNFYSKAYDVANGPYYNTVVKTTAGGRIGSWTLRPITFLDLAPPAAP